MKRVLLAAWALLCAAQLQAKIELPAVLGDGMVLQRNAEAALWGKAAPGRRVRIATSWNGRTTVTTADAAGRWAAKVPTGDAGGPYTVAISDGEEVVL